MRGSCSEMRIALEVRDWMAIKSAGEIGTAKTKKL